MKLVLSTAPDGYPYLFWLRNVGLYPHKTHDRMDDSRADVFGELLRSHADGCDPLENEPNMTTSSEDDANALDIEAARKHTTFSDGSTLVFFCGSSCKGGECMQLEEVEIGGDALPKHSADDEAIVTNEARDDTCEGETVQPDREADRSRTYLRAERLQVDVLASLALRADPQLTRVMDIILSLSMAWWTSLTERTIHLLYFVHVHRQEILGVTLGGA